MPSAAIILSTPQQVSEWLARYKLSQFNSLFQFHKLQGEALLEIEYKDLRQLGVTRISDRKHILRAISDLQQGKFIANPEQRNQLLLQARDKKMHLEAELYRLTTQDDELNDAVEKHKKQISQIREMEYRARIEMKQLMQEQLMMEEQKLKLQEENHYLKEMLQELDSRRQALEQELNNS